MSYTYGLVNQRTLPEMEVLRNYNPTSPEGYTHAARAKDSIKSGQAMVLDDNGNWVLADADEPTHLGKEIFFALKDSDASSLGQAAFDAFGAALGKADAIAGQGEVVGYSSMGQYVLRHGWFTGVPTDGEFLTISSTPGSLAATTAGSGLPIVGRMQGNVLTINDTATSPGTVLNTINSNVPQNTAVITFKTFYALNAVDQVSGA